MSKHLKNGQYNKKHGQYQYIYSVVVVSILTNWN